MKTFLKILLLSGIGLFVTAAGCTPGGSREQSAEYYEDYTGIRNYDDVDISRVPDGEYEGYCKYKSLADARVSVSVAGGRIEKIRVLKHRHFPFISGKKVADRIVEKQSLDVDVVSGATGSSYVMRKAVEIALKQGMTTGHIP